MIYFSYNNCLLQICFDNIIHEIALIEDFIKLISNFKRESNKKNSLHCFSF